LTGQSHDYRRHGTTTLFAALEVATAKVIAAHSASGLQFFGHVGIEGRTGVMTVTLKDVDDHALWSTKLEPKSA
jgi:hypothetical protein